MKAPNGLEVMIGDLWDVGSVVYERTVLVLSFETEPLAAFCKVFCIQNEEVDFLGFNGNPERYRLISRINDHS